MEDLNVNLAVGRMLMNTTLRAAVHLGKDYDTNLHFAKYHIWDSLGQSFGEIKAWFVNYQKSLVLSSHKFDVQETNFSLSQFNWIWSYLFGSWSAHGWNSRSRSLGSGYWSIAFFPENLPVRGDLWRDETHSKHTNTSTKKHINRDDVDLLNVDPVTANAKPSHLEAMLYILKTL